MSHQTTVEDWEIQVGGRFLEVFVYLMWILWDLLNVSRNDEVKNHERRIFKGSIYKGYMRIRENGNFMPWTFVKNLSNVYAAFTIAFFLFLKKNHTNYPAKKISFEKTIQMLKPSFNDRVLAHQNCTLIDSCSNSNL